MSINHTLSLQVHPTKVTQNQNVDSKKNYYKNFKEQAITLNWKDPLNYPDQNHKPELAYALTQFELLCGFRPQQEIVKNMKGIKIGMIYFEQIKKCQKSFSLDKKIVSLKIFFFISIQIESF
jgi:mannose-6-phosphate isomerase class I